MDSALLSRMQTLCSRREYCSSEIAGKIRKSRPELSSEEVDEMIGSLREDGYIDELRYASAFCRDKSSLQGWGPVKIRYMLRSKGIPPHVITAALEEIDRGKASQKLYKMLEAKAKTLEGDPQKKYKLLKFALSRGYEPAELDFLDEIL